MMMMKDVKLEAIDQSVSMLMKKEPCNHDPAVSLASNQTKSPVVMKHAHQQAGGSYNEMNSAFGLTKEPKGAVNRGSSQTNNSSNGSSTVPQLHPRDPRRRPRVIRASSSLASATSDILPSLASSPSNVAVNKSPVVVQQAAKSPVAVNQAVKSPVVVNQAVKSPGIVDQAAKRPVAVNQAVKSPGIVDQAVKRPVAVNQAVKSLGIVDQAVKSPGIADQAAKIATSSPFNPSSHVESNRRGWASSAVNNKSKSPVSKQADVVFGRVSLRAAADDTMHHDQRRPVKIENNNEQATLNSGVNTSTSVVHDGDCSAKPIVLSEATTTATTVEPSSSNNKTLVSPAAYHASRRERFSSEKVYTTSIPPYDAPSTSPRQQAATTATTTVSVKRTAETSVDELRCQEQQTKSDDENVIAMENMLSDLKGKLVTLTLDLCISPHAQELSEAYAATTTQIDYVKRTIASLKKQQNKDAASALPSPSSLLFAENYKKQILMMRLVPYFQWEGNITNAREKVFNTIYACLRQVDRAAQDNEFDIERHQWRSLIPPKLSSPMHHWLDGLLVRKPHLTWSQFKLDLLQEYEMPKAKALKQLTLAHYNAQTESMNSFVNRFIRHLEYAKVSEALGATYFFSALPSLDERAKFKLLYQTCNKNHPHEVNNIYRAIDLFRDIHNQACECNDAYKNPALPAPQPQPYELHQRMSPQPPQQQQHQEKSVSPKVEDIQVPQQQQPNKVKKQKFNHPKKPLLRCLFHPKAHSHLTQNCRNNPLSSSYVNV